jgi:hypothetical protein
MLLRMSDEKTEIITICLEPLLRELKINYPDTNVTIEVYFPYSNTEFGRLIIKYSNGNYRIKDSIEKALNENYPGGITTDIGYWYPINNHSFRFFQYDLINLDADEEFILKLKELCLRCDRRNGYCSDIELAGAEVYEQYCNEIGIESDYREKIEKLFNANNEPET